MLGVRGNLPFTYTGRYLQPLLKKLSLCLKSIYDSRGIWLYMGVVSKNVFTQTVLRDKFKLAFNQCGLDVLWNGGINLTG